MIGNMTGFGIKRSWLHRVVEFFGPQWFGSTMGIGALGVALSLLSSQLDVPALADAALLVVVFTIGLTVLYTVPWLLRFGLYPDRVRHDLTHPIRSQFFPTMPITLLIVGIGVKRTMGGLLPAQIVDAAVLALFAVGSLGIVSFGFLVVSIMFTNSEIETQHGVFAWYIPPVSHLVIPLLGLLLVETAYAGTGIGRLLFVVSMIGLGVGLFMFLFFGSIVLYRYAYETLPRAKLAPTFVIGLAPTSVLVIDIGRLIRALKAGVGFDIALAPILPALKLVAMLLWGFSAWWFVLTAAIVVYYVRRHEHPFFFTWWAYTFPVGAFAISTGVLSHLLSLQALSYVFAAVTAVLFASCTVTTLLTGRMVVRGHAFAPE
jgi:C4-dicarboxylate transporter/malic acid transport protein